MAIFNTTIIQYWGKCNLLWDSFLLSFILILMEIYVGEKNIIIWYRKMVARPKLNDMEGSKSGWKWSGSGFNKYECS